MIVTVRTRCSYGGPPTGFVHSKDGYDVSKEFTPGTSISPRASDEVTSDFRCHVNHHACQGTAEEGTSPGFRDLNFQVPWLYKYSTSTTTYLCTECQQQSFCSRFNISLPAGIDGGAERRFGRQGREMWVGRVFKCRSPAGGSRGIVSSGSPHGNCPFSLPFS